MSKRIDYTDKIVYHRISGDVAAYHNLNNRRHSVRIDTKNCRQFGIIVDVLRIGEGKRLSFLWESSEVFGAGYRDELEGVSNFERDDFVTSPGLYNVAYWGERRFIRLETITRTTNPQATFRQYLWRGGFVVDPKNLPLQELSQPT